MQTRTFAYNSLSRLTSAANPESGTINYVYDHNGNLTSKTDARGVKTDYIYDALNRVTNRNYSLVGSTPPNYQPSPNVTYFYDGTNVAGGIANSKGKLTKVSSSVSTTEYVAFDILGRVTRSKQTTDGVEYGGGTDATKWMTYTYNLSGALIEQQYPSGRMVRNTLDSDGSLQQVQSRRVNDTFRNYANAFTYTAAGAVSAMRLGNGKWETTQFNSRLQPTQIGLGTSATNQGLLKLNYDYGTTDNNGNIKSQIINTGIATFTQTYLYDSLNRLTEAKELNASNQQTWKQNFGYDRFGNRTSFTETILNPDNTTTTNNQTPQIDASNNRFTTASGFVYDLSGNVITDNQGRTFNYDGENKQTKVLNNQGAAIGEYKYDGNGSRVKKIAGNDITIFVYDAASKLVAEYSTESNSNPQINYTTADTLESPRIITNQTGDVVSRRDFLPFGEEIARANYGSDSVREKFATYERDTETSLDFAQARYYTKAQGRFYSVDPENAGASADNPQTWNAYAYVGNNPINVTDPTGLDWYFNKELNKYKWYEEKEKIDDGYVRVVGNTGEAGSFSYQAEDGTWVALDPYSKTFQKNIASKEDAMKLADRLYQFDPDKRAFAAGYNKNYDRNMTILTVAMLADIAIIAGPTVALSGAGTTTLGLTETAVTAAPVGAALLNQLMTKAEFVKELTSKTQFVYRGNAQEIFDRIAEGATRIGPNAVRMADGKVVSIYESSKAGPLQGPTIQVVENGIKYVYRIKQ